MIKKAFFCRAAQGKPRLLVAAADGQPIGRVGAVATLWPEKDFPRFWYRLPSALKTHFMSRSLIVCAQSSGGTERGRFRVTKAFVRHSDPDPNRQRTREM